MPSEYIYLGISAILTVLWWLLRQKDAKQQDEIRAVQAAQSASDDKRDKEIGKLWERHDADVRELQDLKLQLAKMHYEKPEVDAMFNALKQALNDGFDKLGKKFDTLSEALNQHMIEERKAKQ